MTSADWLAFERYWSDVEIALRALLEEILLAQRAVEAAALPTQPGRADTYRHWLNNMARDAHQFETSLSDHVQTLRLLCERVPHPANPHMLLPCMCWERLLRWWSEMRFHLRHCTANLMMAANQLAACAQHMADGHPPMPIQTLQDRARALDETLLESERAGRIATEHILDEYGDAQTDDD